jgi:hypothetical protein
MDQRALLGCTLERAQPHERSYKASAAWQVERLEYRTVPSIIFTMLRGAPRDYLTSRVIHRSSISL